MAPRTSPDRCRPPTRNRHGHAAWPRRSPCGNSDQAGTRGSTREMSAQTAARAPAARPPSPPDRPRWESPARAARRPPWGSSPGESRPADTSPTTIAVRSFGAIDRPLLAQRADRQPVRTRSALVRDHLQHRRDRVARPPPPSSPTARSPRLTIAFGTPARPARDRSRTPRERTPRVFCCRDRQPQLHRRLLDRDRLPLPAGADPAGWAGITPPSGTTRSSDFCWAISRRYRLGLPAHRRSPTDLPG